MPEFVKNRCRILPNYPYQRNPPPRIPRSGKLCILFNGWMGKNRGTEIIEGLLATGLPLKVIMAGWFSDEETRLMVEKHPESIAFRGVVPQETSLLWAEKEADYILCVYAPVNENNINASPNKIYDAIHTGTPVIVNSEIRISSFTEENGIGFILPAYQCSDFTGLYHELMARRNAFHWSHELKNTFSWENAEEVLLECHNLI